MKNLFNLLYNKYNKSTLIKKEFAHELGVSVGSLDRLVINKADFPKPIKLGTANSSSVRFNIIDVAEYLTSNTTKDVS